MIQVKAEGNSADSMSQCAREHMVTVEARPLGAL